MAWISTANLTQAVSEIKAFCQGLFFPKSGGTVTGSVTATGEVTATETAGQTSIAHNLTEKLDEEDYLAGMTWDYLEAHFTWDDLDGTSTSGEDTYTPNLNLTKPGRLSTAAINNDLDILDTKIGAVGSTSLQAQVDNGYSLATNDELTIGVNYTTPSRGLLRVGGYGGTIIIVSINSVEMARFEANTISGGNTIHSIYLPKGATVRISASDDTKANTRRFYY